VIDEPSNHAKPYHVVQDDTQVMVRMVFIYTSASLPNVVAQALKPKPALTAKWD
jgi:hypothetical protein